MKRQRRLPFGAEMVDDGVRFRLWAPGVAEAEVVIEDGPTLALRREAGGFFERLVGEAHAGTRYRYRVAGMDVPDPASRFQPQGVAGPSEVVDPGAHDWRDEGWRGRAWHESVLYELHPGTFSASGDFDGIERHFDHLLDLGVDTIGIMPVAECPGRWNWGYDGVLPFAVEERYGGPAGFKRLIDAAHGRGISVVLDVVYNHFGPEGNHLARYAPPFFTDRHRTPWGAGINFDGGHSATVRAFFIENALYWLQEFHLDGLRLDAVHAIADDSRPDFVAELGGRVRAEFGDRPIHLILENDRNRSSVLGAGYGGPGPYTAQWDDDWHHVLRVAVTGAGGGYYDDYTDSPLEHRARALAEGFAYQGEASPHRGGAPRGEPSASLPPTAFVSFIQNHDQVGNHAYGWRLGRLAPAEAIRAATAVLLLSPQIPMLWQGQEWNSDQPFPFFCDFDGDLAEAVRKGRLEEFKSFREFQDAAARARIPDPLAEATFCSAVLDWSAPRQDQGSSWLALHRALIAVRREHVIPHLATAHGGEGCYDIGPDTRIDVQWRFADRAVLQLIANLAPHAAAADTGSRLGRCVWSTHAASGAKLPPWFVALNIADAEGDSG